MDQCDDLAVRCRNVLQQSAVIGNRCTKWLLFLVLLLGPGEAGEVTQHHGDHRGVPVDLRPAGLRGFPARTGDSGLAFVALVAALGSNH